MTKRSNGEGTIRQRADGTWEARYTSPKDRKQKSVYGSTQREVRRKLLEKTADIETGFAVDPSNMSVHQWLDIWMSDFCTSLKESTRASYRQSIEAHIKPRTEGIKLQKLDKMAVQRIVNDMLAYGLAPSTTTTIKITLSSAMEKAVDLGLIKLNPCRKVTVAKTADESDGTDSMHILDRSQMPAFLEALEGSQHKNIITFGLFTGMRAGELRGLRWTDIDWEQQSCMVVQQISYVDKAYKVTLPKRNKKRNIQLPQAAIDLLKQQKISQLEQRLAAGPAWIEDELSKDLVFRMRDGSHYKVRALNFAVKKAGKAVGLPDMSPHDLRHSFAVASIRAGVSVKTIQYTLGHASISTTLDTYGHYTNEMGRYAAHQLDAYWAGTP